jgi:hypothetical protein
VDRGRGFIVELHWRADPDVRVPELDDARWWQSLPSATISGRRVATLAPEELLLVLCLHGTKHRWSSLGWLVDVAEMIRAHPRLDWDRLLAAAQRHRCVRRVNLGLSLARTVLDAPLPAGVVALPGDDGIESRIVDAFFATREASPSMARELADNVRLQDTAAQRAGYLWRVLMTPGWGEWERWRLPPALSFLYLPLRFGRLAAKYGARIFTTRPRIPAGATPRTPPPRPRSTG